MSYTPSQLREWADDYDRGEVQPGVTKPNRAEAYRALAAALERIERLQAHAEAMVNALDDGQNFGAWQSVIDAFRRDFPKEGK